MKRLSLGMLAILAVSWSAPSFAADEFTELATNTIFGIIKAVAPNATAFRLALDKLNENVERALPKSMMDEASLKQLETNTLELNRVVPKPLPALNNKEAIEKIASGGKGRGTLTGASDELQRLDRAGRAREEEIAQLKKARDDLKGLASTYKDTTEVAGKLSDKIGKLASSPTIEFYSRLTGRSVGLSWADFETELLPALAKRQEAAERAADRLDQVIKSSEKDLKDFNESKLFANAIFAQHVGSANGLDASAVPGTSAVKLAEIGSDMQEDSKATMELAEKMREEASEIRKWNAGISKFQSMVNWISMGLTGSSGGQAGEEPKKEKGKTFYYSVLTRNGNDWELRSGKVEMKPKQ
ncbi:hypothetical protein [Bradyrhizobium sp. 2TAF24]|uniref:hypothetical protein n=1 Tax=Bradyrhizobium sp. 2TAF24 TaxID=3233011 RepID=UPI003F8DE911